MAVKLWPVWIAAAAIGVYACVEPMTPASHAAASASASALPPLPLPGEQLVDASLMDPKEAGTSSDCVPAAPSDDGNVEQAFLGATGATLSLCIGYRGPLTEARTGRACYEVDLTQGRYDRLAPFGPPAPATPRLVRHESHGFTVKANDGGDVDVCKGDACQTVHLEKWAPLPQREACVPDLLATHAPADVSPDGATLFVVRQGCPGAPKTAETYDVKTKHRLAQFPLKGDDVVDLVAWLGARVVVRGCTEDEKACTAYLVDPKAPATPAAHGYANAPAIPSLNPAGLDPFFFHADGGDLWALVDRLGAAVVWVHADSGKIERTVTLPAAPDIARPIAVGVRPQPAQLYVVYGGTGRTLLLDLATGAQVASYRAPTCGERY